MKENKGILFILSGPSGVGKGTVRKALNERGIDLAYSVSATTRPPREGEQDGIDYFFKTKAAFESMIQTGRLLEWAQYVGNYYGTPVDYVEETLNAGQDVLLEIEIQGARKVAEVFPDGVFVFLLPPSLRELKNRIVNRGAESEGMVGDRLAVARKEIEMMTDYDYVVENDIIKQACERIEAIVTAERCRKDRLIDSYLKILEGTDDDS